MKKLLFKGLLFLFPLAQIHAHDGNLPEDQLLVIFGSSGYVLFKVLDFANDHGYPYIKILNYEFTAFDHTATGKWNGEARGGRFFELIDDNSKISFLCFEKKPDDPYIIDLEKYRSLLEKVEIQN